MLTPDTARPHVTLHFAQSIDGRIATRTGASKWISGPEATRFSHELRTEADAVIIGSETALVDDPRLTVRLVDGSNPIRVVLDTRERVPESSHLLSDPTARTILVGKRRRPTSAAHVTSWALPVDAVGRVLLDEVLRMLHAEGARRVLVEGGQSVITSFIRAGLADRLVVTVAPLFIGSGVDSVGQLEVDAIDQARRYRCERSWRLGEDVMIELGRRT